jgi:hypothetical protein
MTKITFTAQNVMSDQLANRTGNLSKKLYDMDNSMAGGSQGIPVGLGSEISQTNPYGGGIPENSTPSAFGFDTEGQDKQLNAYLNQVRLSSYYQQNPDVVLGPSAKYSQLPMGGPMPTTVPAVQGAKLQRKVEHFTDDIDEQEPFIRPTVLENFEDTEETPTEQLLYLVGTGIALTSLVGISIALTYSSN